MDETPNAATEEPPDDRAESAPNDFEDYSPLLLAVEQLIHRAHLGKCRLCQPFGIEPR